MTISRLWRFVMMNKLERMSASVVHDEYDGFSDDCCRTRARAPSLTNWRMERHASTTCVCFMSESVLINQTHECWMCETTLGDNWRRTARDHNCGNFLFAYFWYCRLGCKVEGSKHIFCMTKVGLSRNRWQTTTNFLHSRIFLIALHFSSTEWKWEQCKSKNTFSLCGSSKSNHQTELTGNFQTKYRVIGLLFVSFARSCTATFRCKTKFYDFLSSWAWVDCTW